MSEPVQVSVKILDKEYQFSCPRSERADLINSAEFLNARMQQIRDHGRVVGVDRIAVMAALNIANDLLKVRSQGNVIESDLGLKLKSMRERVETALEHGKQLEL